MNDQAVIDYIIRLWNDVPEEQKELDTDIPTYTMIGPDNPAFSFIRKTKKGKLILHICTLDAELHVTKKGKLKSYKRIEQGVQWIPYSEIHKNSWIERPFVPFKGEEN